MLDDTLNRYENSFFNIFAGKNWNIKKILYLLLYIKPIYMQEHTLRMWYFQFELQ